MEIIILCFTTAFTLTYFAIPSIIRVALAKNLCDEPGERSSHSVRTPSLGGIAIFSGSIFSIVLWTPFFQFSNLQYILCAFILLFLVGAKDDIAPIAVSKKLVAQFLAATILVLKSDISLHHLYGFLGSDSTLPGAVTYVLSILTILFIINSFNLLDGIDGLAGSAGILILSTLGCWFFLIQRMEFATVAFATSGALAAFLRYNITPAKIFMGDTGSLFIGIVSALLIIKFIDMDYALPATAPYRINNIPAVAMGILILPLFDTLRVFVTRILRRKSPFKPDRRHIHHLLIDYGFSHLQATGILLFVNTVFIVFALTLHDLVGLHTLLISIFALATLLTFWLNRAIRQKIRTSAVKPAIQ